MVMMMLTMMMQERQIFKGCGMNSCQGDAICADDDVYHVDDVKDDGGGGDDAGGMNSCQDDAICALSSIARKPPHSYHQDYPVHIHHSYCNIIINNDQLDLFLIHIYALFQKDGLVLLIGKFISRCSTLLTKKLHSFIYSGQLFHHS